MRSFLEFISLEESALGSVLNFGDYNLQQKFNHYNQLLFKNQIPSCPITYADLRDMAGATYYKMQGRKVIPGSVRIEISTHFKATEESLDATLVHEMIHAYLATEGDPDPHHGPQFRRMVMKCEARLSFKIPLKDDIHNLELTNPNMKETLVVLRTNKHTGDNEVTFLLPSIARDHRQMQALFNKYKPYFYSGMNVEIFTTHTSIFGRNFQMMPDVANGSFYKLKPASVEELKRNANYIQRWAR